MLPDLEDPDWSRQAALDPALNAVSAEGLVFDALILPHQIDAIAELAARHPQLSIVLDHGAKPKLGQAGAMATWARDLAMLAAAPNVTCKISGLLTELAPHGSSDDVTQAIGELYDLFGPSRLLWGSDWPVLTLAGDYHGWFELARTAIAAKESSAVRAAMGDNALRIYRPRRR